MILVVCLPLVLSVAADTGCIAWVCDSSGAAWTANECAMRHPNNITEWDLKPNVCNSDEYCPAELGSGVSTSVNCVKIPPPQAQFAAYPGERCDRLHTCIGNNIQCTNNVCATTSPCVDVQDCGLGKTCSTGKCANLVDVGQPCTVDTDCVINAGCDIDGNGVVGTGVCVVYNSVSAGSAVQTCTGTTSTPAPHALCASGYCYATATKGKYACTGMFTSSGSLPSRCESFTSTCVSAKDSVSGLTLTQNCECGLDGYPYCPLFPGDPDFQAYLSVTSNYMSSSSLSYCNTARHGLQGSLFNLANYFWCGQNLTDNNQTYAYLRGILYPDVVMASDCVLSILEPEYYNSTVNPTPPDNEKAGMMLLSGAILTLFH